MKLVKFVKDKGKGEWTSLFEKIFYNLEDGKTVVIGSKEDIKLIEDLLGRREE